MLRVRNDTVENKFQKTSWGQVYVPITHERKGKGRNYNFPINSVGEEEEENASRFKNVSESRNIINESVIQK